MHRTLGISAAAVVMVWVALGALLVSAPEAHAATYSQVVDNSTSGRFAASSRWISSSWSSQRYGGNYRVLKKPLSFSDNAKYKIKTPAKAAYRVYARWPATSGYNNRTRFFVKTASGWKAKVVSQRTNGGKWVLLGKYTLDAGDSYRVQVSSRSPGTGYIIADAVKVVRVTTSTYSGKTGYDILREAKTWLGVPYKYGGTTKQGVDCSGLSMMVYKNVTGIQLPHNAADQWNSGIGTRVSTYGRGYLVFGHADGGSGVEHVGILTGDGRMIHAPQPGTVVRYDNVSASWYNVVGIKRIVPSG